MLSPRELLSVSSWQHWLHDDPVRALLAVITVLVWLTAMRLVIALLLAVTSCTLSWHGSTGVVRRRLALLATHAAPRWARPLVLAAVAVPVLTGPGLAANASVAHRLPSLDRPGAPVTQLAPASTHTTPTIGAPTTLTPAPPAVPGSGKHVVVQGESLWSIAADELGPHAAPAAVAHRWPQWWHANQDTIGSDPRVIHPGQQLQIPAQDKDDSR